MPTHFPKPWRIEETDACWIVSDANGVPLGYFYWQTSELAVAERPSKAQAKRLALEFWRIGQ